MSDNQLSIKTLNFSGVCINVSSNKSFEDVTNSIESMIGKANNMLLQKLVNTNASSDDFKTALNSMLGTGSFIRFVDFESGQYLSLCGRTKKAKLYIIGNPLIANQMYELNPAVGLFVPLKLFVYDDYQDQTHIAYVKPSSVLGQFDDEKILEVAQLLDQKLEEVATRASVHQGKRI